MLHYNNSTYNITTHLFCLTYFLRKLNLIGQDDNIITTIVRETYSLCLNNENKTDQLCRRYTLLSNKLRHS